MLLTNISLFNLVYAETVAKTIVMPFKLTGNIDTKVDDEHKQRLSVSDAELRKALQATGKYDLVDVTASKDFSDKVIEALHNNDCNKCEAEYAKPLNAKLIIAPYVYRVSQLVLTMHFVTLDAETSKIIAKKALDFRGDNDESWKHAIHVFVKNAQKQ